MRVHNFKKHVRIGWVVIVAAALLAAAGVLIGGLPHATAQGVTPRPAILVFESSIKTVTASEAEGGEASTTLSWRTLGMTDEYHLEILGYRMDRWEQLFGPLGATLEPNGSREVLVLHPMGFGPPTYLLSLVKTDTNAVVDQRVLPIPYAEDESAPSIRAFAANVDSVSVADLTARTSFVEVKWEIAHRSATSQPVFEQVFADGSAQSVELPRADLWIPSISAGPVAPVLRLGEDTITLRMRLIDLVTEEVYDEAEIVLEVVGDVSQPVQPPTLTPAPQVGAATVASFLARPAKVNPGQAVTLSWEIVGAGGVVIEQVVPGMAMPVTVVNAQSPQGSATVYLPDYAAYSVIYVLRTVVGGTTAQAVVEVNCLRSFFFEGGDGCPLNDPRSVPASIQTFENGLMVWRSDTNEIMVIYDHDKTGGTAASFPETSFAALPEVVLSEVPPLNRTAPMAGFGKVWANVPDVRARLGWALGPEQGYSMTVQDVAGTRQPQPMAQVYFTLPEGQVIGIGYGQWFRVIP